jgi:hypothetical protein
MRRRRLRPFRLGLWLGIIAGALWFVQRYQRSRTEVESGDGSGWSLVEPVTTVTPPAAAAAPEPIPDVPVVPVVEPEVLEAGDVAEVPGEPPIEPVAVPPEEEPAAAPPVTKAAAPRKRAAKKAAAPPAQVAPAWVVPDPGGICPTTHPVKGKLSSKLFHLPGMFAYNRTNPDRCYRDEEAAEADGLRKAKR